MFTSYGINFLKNREFLRRSRKVFGKFASLDRKLLNFPRFYQNFHQIFRDFLENFRNLRKFSWNMIQVSLNFLINLTKTNKFSNFRSVNIKTPNNKLANLTPAFGSTETCKFYTQQFKFSANYFSSSLTFQLRRQRNWIRLNPRCDHQQDRFFYIFYWINRILYSWLGKNGTRKEEINIA